MKIVNIIGGIGNQMFQYAFAYAMQLRHPEEKIYIDTSLFNGYGLHNGFEIKRVFGLQLPIASWKEIITLNWYLPDYKLSRAVRKIFPKRKSVVLDPEYHTFNPKITNETGNRYYDGYWQTPMYFDEYKEHIIRLFSFPRFTDKKNCEIADKIVDGNSVTIHIRRGDYVNAKNYKGLCEIDYYKRAIEEACKWVQNPEYYVFSNDIEWCKSNILHLLNGNTCHFIDWNQGKESHNDMHLMTLARCNILANSSFSWWGAYLNVRKDKITICPKKWVNLVSDRDLYLEDWMKV